ncbi:Uncharacterised protein [Mycobacteroides abscessus subsp. abscessus]|nr:Uncharacterised protein [Mycobacteroides abscessus subsp. abscessus]
MDRSSAAGSPPSAAACRLPSFRARFPISAGVAPEKNCPNRSVTCANWDSSSTGPGARARMWLMPFTIASTCSPEIAPSPACAANVGSIGRAPPTRTIRSATAGAHPNDTNNSRGVRPCPAATPNRSSTPTVTAVR